MFFARTQKDPTPAQRLTALLAALVVLALTVFAASPTLHAWLHGETASAPVHAPAHGSPSGLPAGGHDDSLCAVTLFAQGIVALVFLVLLVGREDRSREYALIPVDTCRPRSIRHRLPPHCGPPQF